jgi:hypothetical protein
MRAIIKHVVRACFQVRRGQQSHMRRMNQQYDYHSFRDEPIMLIILPEGNFNTDHMHHLREQPFEITEPEES